RVFARFAQVWDPAGILAPGGMRATRRLDADLALEGVPTRDLGLLTSPDGAHPVQACIGVGRCRTSSGGVMCPSFRATGDEKDSTRGRARVLQEVVRGTLPITDPGVGESLDLCLSCKACSSDCPTGVDMAAYKAETLHRRYRRRVRPMAHYSLGPLPLRLRGTPRAAGPPHALTATRAAPGPAAPAGTRPPTEPRHCPAAPGVEPGRWPTPPSACPPCGYAAPPAPPARSTRSWPPGPVGPPRGSAASPRAARSPGSPPPATCAPSSPASRAACGDSANRARPPPTWSSSSTRSPAACAPPSPVPPPASSAAPTPPWPAAPATAAG